MVRVVLHVLVGLKFGEIVVLDLPEVTLPSWAAGIQLGGTVYLEGLLARGRCSGLRLAVIIACIGAANALANPKRLLRVAALRAARDRVRRRRLGVGRAPARRERAAGAPRAAAARRHHPRHPVRCPSVALPVLEDTLERSLLLAAAMDSRGYGRAGAAPRSATACSPAR